MITQVNIELFISLAHQFRNFAKKIDSFEPTKAFKFTIFQSDWKKNSQQSENLEICEESMKERYKEHKRFN